MNSINKRGGESMSANADIFQKTRKKKSPLTQSGLFRCLDTPAVGLGNKASIHRLDNRNGDFIMQPDGMHVQNQLRLQGVV